MDETPPNDEEAQSARGSGEEAELRAWARADEAAAALAAIRRSLRVSISRRMANLENFELLDAWVPAWIERTEEKLHDLLYDLGTGRLDAQVDLVSVLESRSWDYFSYAGAVLVLMSECNRLAVEGEQREYGPSNPTVEAIAEIHAHALIVADEVLSLLRLGFGEGAHARWRTLFEMQVTCSAILAGGDPIATRYLASSKVELRRLALAGDLRPVPIGPLTRADTARLDSAIAEADQVIVEHGPEMAKSYGWASPLTGTSQPSFRRLALAVGEDTLYRRYKTASHAVHGNRSGSFRAVAGGFEFSTHFEGAAAPLSPVMWEVVSSLAVIGECLYWASAHDPEEMYLWGLAKFAIEKAQVDAMHAQVRVPPSWASTLITRDWGPQE